MTENEMTENEIEELLLRLKNSKLVLWGCGRLSRLFLELYSKLEVEIVAFCDNDETLCGKKHLGVPVYSPQELAVAYQNRFSEESEKSMLVQLGVMKDYHSMLISQLEELGIEQCDIISVTMQELYKVLISYFFQCCPNYEKEDKVKGAYEDSLEMNKGRLRLPAFQTYDHLVVCQPAKTGDLTITTTYSKNVGVLLGHYHSSSAFDKKFVNEKEKLVKVTTAVREPIIQALSGCFHLCAHGELFKRDYLTFEDYADFLHSGDIQNIFDKVRIYNPDFYSSYFGYFGNDILDITLYPFDQEKGVLYYA